MTLAPVGQSPLLGGEQGTERLNEDALRRLIETIPQLGGGAISGAQDAFLESIAESLRKLAEDGLTIPELQTQVIANFTNTFAIDQVVNKFSEDEFTASASQTVFTLSEPFKAGGFNAVFVNGVGYAEGTDYTISGTTLTWLDTSFALSVGDSVVAKYSITGPTLFFEDEFTPTLGQTVFTLNRAFEAGGLSVVFVNGVTYADGTDYTIVGKTFTWLDVPFTLGTTDSLVVKYQRA